MLTPFRAGSIIQRYIFYLIFVNFEKILTVYTIHAPYTRMYYTCTMPTMFEEKEKSRLFFANNTPHFFGFHSFNLYMQTWSYYKAWQKLSVRTFLFCMHMTEVFMRDEERKSDSVFFFWLLSCLQNQCILLYSSCIIWVNIAIVWALNGIRLAHFHFSLVLVYVFFFSLELSTFHQ